MLLCLHEEAAVAIAHGYAKVTGKAMAAAVHSNVGLLHATMAIFNAWCDRMPILILGATGPVDAMKRRPWIDWIHTAADQGALIRNFTKWDDQPASAGAARESVLRAYWMSNTAPCGPTYINLDAEVQEGKLPAPLPPIDAKRYMPPVVQGPSADLVKKAADILLDAKKPLILAGRMSRKVEDWKRRIELAEAIDARVATNLKIGAAFPTDHPLHIGYPATFATDDLINAVKDADVILSLDWVDLGGTFKAIGGVPSATVIQVSLDQNLHNGWSMDYEGLPAVDLFIPAETDATVAALLEAVSGKAKPKKPHLVREHPLKAKPAPDSEMAAADMANVLRHVVGDRTTCLTHVSLSWHGEFWPFRHPLDYVGSDGGGGVGGGPGISVGAALALKGTRPPADRGLRRRRLHDGQHGGLDCGALPHSDPVPGGQQSLVLQRRGPSGACRRCAQSARSTTSGSASASPIRTSTSAWSRAARAPRASGRAAMPASLRRRSRRRSRWSRPAASPWSTRASSAATVRRPLRRWPAARPIAAPDINRR